MKADGRRDFANRPWQHVVPTYDDKQLRLDDTEPFQQGLVVHRLLHRETWQGTDRRPRHEIGMQDIGYRFFAVGDPECLGIGDHSDDRYARKPRDFLQTSKSERRGANERDSHEYTNMNNCYFRRATTVMPAS